MPIYGEERRTKAYLLCSVCTQIWTWLVSMALPRQESCQGCLRSIHDTMMRLLPRAGSPLGLFLALRKVDPRKGRALGTAAAAGLMLGAQASQPGSGDGLPAVHRMYNLYHPFDPVGYR